MSFAHAIGPEHDRRHVPGPDALPLWSESWWFPFHDPASEVSVVFRAGVYAQQRRANLFLFVAHRGALVHTFVEHAAPLPPVEDGGLSVCGLRVEWEVPLERFRLRYDGGGTRFDVRWTATSPAYAYPHPPDVSYDVLPGHIEQGGRAAGTVTVGGVDHPIDCLAHRDHSWGGERDWAKFRRWTYLSGELPSGTWFNAVRIDLDGAVIHVGGLWDGLRLHTPAAIAIDDRTTDGGTRQSGVACDLTDEDGRLYRFTADAPAVICPVQMGRTWLKDGVVRWRRGDEVGWGIHEHGYLEHD